MALKTNDKINQMFGFVVLILLLLASYIVQNGELIFYLVFISVVVLTMRIDKHE